MPACLRLPPAAVWLLAAAWLSGCGYVGDPLPPSLNIPERITDLSAIEFGDRLVIDFTAPSLTTDGVLMHRLGEVEVRIGPATDGWADQGRPFSPGTDQPGPVRLEVPADHWIGTEVAIGARTASRKGRYSEWSNLVRIEVVPPLRPPVGVQAEPAPGGVRLRWRPAQERPQLEYRLFRRAATETEPTLLGQVAKPEYVDTAVRFGVPYEYTVQAVLSTGDARAISEPSEPVSIAPLDRFPPATPAGLAAVPTMHGIELSWDPSPEADLAGYYLYRSVNGEDFQRAAELLPVPSFSDRAVESGKHYRYAISAVDQAGNESARSEPVEATAH